MNKKASKEILSVVSAVLVIITSLTLFSCKGKKRGESAASMLCMDAYWTEHGYDYNKRAAVYPFLARYLGPDLSKAVNPDGSLKEEGIIIEDQKVLYAFDEKHPFPATGVRRNDDIIWN